MCLDGSASEFSFDDFLFFEEQGSIFGHSIGSHFASFFGPFMGGTLCFDEHLTGSTSQLTGFFDFLAHSLNRDFEIRTRDPVASELLSSSRGLEGTTIIGCFYTCTCNCISISIFDLHCSKQLPFLARALFFCLTHWTILAIAFSTRSTGKATQIWYWTVCQGFT